MIIILIIIIIQNSFFKIVKHIFLSGKKRSSSQGTTLRTVDLRVTKETQCYSGLTWELNHSVELAARTKLCRPRVSLFSHYAHPLWRCDRNLCTWLYLNAWNFIRSRFLNDISVVFCLLVRAFMLDFCR